MKRTDPSLSAMLAVLAFGALSLVGGWLIVDGGGFFHSPGRRASGGTFVSGGPAVIMAGLQFLASALAFTWLLRPWMSIPWAVTLAFVGVFLPPVLFTLV